MGADITVWTMTDLTAPQPRYRQLAQTLVSDIRSGRYAVGSMLPTEHELCEQFGASRFTVREAVKQLVEMGLVTRQAGVGTRVLNAQAQTGYSQVMETIEDLRQYTADTELEVLKTRSADLPDGRPEFVGATPKEGWLRIEAIRRVANRRAPPICFTEIYLHPTFRTIRYLGGRVSVPVYVHIEQQFGERIVEVQQQLRAIALPANLASMLKAKAGSPALWVCRSYLNHRGEIIEIATSTHPADRFSYSQAFRRGWRSSTPAT
jgi:DNA-binding GntR family transcriptional regulator